MFKKLLKYDMLAVWRFWWILATGVLVLSTIGAFVLRFVITYIKNPNFSFFTTIGIFFLVICGIAIVSSIVATFIFVYLRFYKNFFTDEGYLTFTLPVSRRMLFLSKTVNALIWESAHVVVLLLSGLIFITIAPPAENGLINTAVFQAIGKNVAYLWNNLGGWMIVYAIELLALALLSGLFSISMIHFCITVGAIVAKKAKLLAAIGIYYGINMLFSFVTQILGTVSLMVLVGGFLEYSMDWSPSESMFSFALILLALCGMMGVLVSLLYGLTLDRIERKLNLA